MKIFWQDERRRAPPHASFHVHPFFSEEPSPFSKSQERMTSLPAPQTASVVKRSLLPTKSEWLLLVEKVLQEIRRGEVEKVVLARCTVLECRERPDPFALTAALQHRAEGAALFCFAEEEKAFLGATPERLLSRTKEQISSMAMAGTRKRGRTACEDRRLERELLSSRKDFREWSFVQNFVHETLSPLCTTPLTFSSLSIYKTYPVQHLYSWCRGRLNAPCTDEALLRALHPTPALCGTPKAQALSLIRTLEPFERGLYGGAIGWQTEEESEWAVAIRSCFIQDKRVYLYVGTGIVEGSNPHEEWEELDQKMKLYEEVFV